MDNKPDPRWKDYEEVFNEKGQAIGFKIPGNEFLFRYENDGGWQDENGNYYNGDGVLVQDQVEDQNDDDQSLDDDLVDQFEELLREEEEGIIKKESIKKIEEQHDNRDEKKQKEEEFKFKDLIQKYEKKLQIKENLPGELCLYFKQRVDFYEEIKPTIEKEQSVQKKNQKIKEIKENIEMVRKELIIKNNWLNEAGTFLDYSGDSEEQSFYDRYWYGWIRTTHQRYLQLFQIISKSKEFKLLEIKTFYALKSKFYPKKEDKMKETIKELTEKVSSINETQNVTLLFDNLPESFPCSFVYDLIEWAGGSFQGVESVLVVDDYSAKVTCNRETALKLVNLEGYNHEKGEYLELSVVSTQGKVYEEGKRKFYYICVDSDYKLHERQLNDTLGFTFSREELAKHNTEVQAKEQKGVRFVLGSIESLRRVLMFRGDSLNVIRVLPQVPK